MKIILLLYVLISRVDLIGQTYFSILGGVDVSKIENFDSIRVIETNLTLLDKGFSIESPFIGIRLKKILARKISISIGSEYMYKKIKAANIHGIVSPKSIGFNYLRNNITFNYKANKYIFGLSGCYNLISSLNYIYSNDKKGSFNTSTNEYGIKAMGTFEIKKYEVGIYFYRGLNSVTDVRNKLHWKPIESVGVSIFYSIQL